MEKIIVYVDDAAYAREHMAQLVASAVEGEGGRRSIIGYTAPSRRVLEVITEDQLERALRQYNEEAEVLERDTAETEARRKAVS